MEKNPLDDSSFSFLCFTGNKKAIELLITKTQKTTCSYSAIIGNQTELLPIINEHKELDEDEELQFAIACRQINIINELRDKFNQKITNIKMWTPLLEFVLMSKEHANTLLILINNFPTVQPSDDTEKAAYLINLCAAKYGLEITIDDARLSLYEQSEKLKIIDPLEKKIKELVDSQKPEPQRRAPVVCLNTF